MNRRLSIGIVLSVLLLGLVLYRVDLSELFRSLKQGNPLLLLCATLSMLSTLLFRAWRWKCLMESIKPIRIAPLVSATSIGAMTDMVLPGRGGDVVRAWLIGHREDVSKMSSLATLVVEKMIDVVMVLLVAIPVLALVTFPGEMHQAVHSLRLMVIVLSVACVSAIGLLVFFATRGEKVREVAESKLAFLPIRWQGGAVNWIESFAFGLRTIRSGHQAITVFLQSLLLWLAFAASNYLILEAFSLQLPLYAALLFLLFQVLGVTLPSSPGFIGTYHAAVVAACSLFNVSNEMALGVAITMHAAFFFPFIIAGFVFLWREDLTLRSLRSLDA